MFPNAQMGDAAWLCCEKRQTNRRRFAGKKDGGLGGQAKAFRHVCWRVDEQQLFLRWLQGIVFSQIRLTLYKQGMAGRLTGAKEFQARKKLGDFGRRPKRRREIEQITHGPGLLRLGSSLRPAR